MNGNAEVKRVSKLKRFFRRKSVWAVAVVLIIAIIGLFSLGGAKPKTVYTTEPAKRGQLKQTVTATGAVESAQDINLSFKASGKIVLVKVKEGDSVKANDVLADLDVSGLSAQISQYRANLALAQANLEKIRAGASPEDISVSQAQVLKVQNDLSSLQAESEAQLAIFRDKDLTTINNAYFTAPVALDQVYNYLINNNTTVSLQVSDNLVASKVKANYLTIQGKLADVKNLIDTANTNKTNDTISAAGNKLVDILGQLNAFLNDAYNMADSIVINSSYPQATKDSIKTAVSSQQSINNASLTALQTAQSNLVNNINSYQSQIQAAQNNLAIYQAQLALKQAGPRDFDIKSAQAAVAQAQAQLDQAQVGLRDYEIIAPVDGIITNVNISVGEQAIPSQTAINMQSLGQYQIKVNIPESDIIKVRVGDKVAVDLDAFGSDHVFTGDVSFIDPAQTVIQDVIYYKTTVVLENDDLTSQIKPGMTANVTISTASKDNVLYIPQRAVKIRATTLDQTPEKYVDILVNGQPEERTVTIGLRGDNGLVEVLSGLSEGDNVITFEKTGP